MKRYEVAYTTADGAREFEECRTKRQAEKFAAKLQGATKVFIDQYEGDADDCNDLTASWDMTDGHEIK